METNFFTQIADLNLTGNIRLNIQPQPDKRLLVSILLTSDELKGTAASNIPPLILDGTADEFDHEFFKSIAQPMQKNTGLLCNLLEHEKGIEKAQAESRQLKEKTQSTTKDSGGKRGKFDQQMAKVTALENQKKIGEAIGQLPDVKQYPEYAEEIKKKSQQLRSQHTTLSLFEQTPSDDNNSEEENNTEVPDEEEEQTEEENSDDDQENEEETDNN
jgi:PRTRC genetic system protein E